MSPAPPAALAAVVLAAGASRRMGAPKAAVRLGDETLLARVVDALAAAACAPIVVVVGVHEAAVRAALPARSTAHVVVNDAPERGQLSSLQTALRHLGHIAPSTPGAVVALVDHPMIARQTVAQLVRAAEAGSHPIVVPTHEGRRGHPIVLLRTVWDEVLATPAGESARAVVGRDRGRVLEVAVADRGILIDVDTPEDLAALRRPAPPAPRR
jgi:CTP:molybdopterin cytidylyltransferase MocA